MNPYKPYPAYKNSGVEWLGEVPAHWEMKPLRWLSSYNDDVLPESTDPETEIEYVDIGSVSSEYGVEKTETMRFESAPSRARRKVKSGDVIISTVRTYLKAIAPITDNVAHVVISTGFAVIRPMDGFDSSYARYALHANYFVGQVIAKSVGVSYPAINASELTSIKLAVPATSEQTAIATFLDRETAKLDTLIAKQETLIELIQEKRQALISHAVTKGLNPDVPMKDSGVEWLGEIPEHWVIKRLKHITPQITVGIVVNPSEYISDDGVPFIYGGDIREGFVDWIKARKISREASMENSKTVLHAGDLLTVRVGAPGVTAVVPDECEGGNCASVMLTRRGIFNSSWLCYAMNARIVRYQVELVQYGAAQEQFNISHAVNFWVLVPPKAEQNQITIFLDRETTKLDTLIEKSRRSIDLMREHRTALISAAVTGKIDVREAT